MYKTYCTAQFGFVAVGEATKLAQTLSSFPQECLRRDRISAFNSCFNASSMAEAFKFELNNAKHLLVSESVQGLCFAQFVIFVQLILNVFSTCSLPSSLFKARE